MLPAFGPNPATMFLSWRGGAKASIPPRQDDFRQVFQGRVQARLSSRDRAVQGAERSLGSGRCRLTNRYLQKQAEPGGQAASGSNETQRISSARGRNRQEEALRTRKRGESQAAMPGLAPSNRDPIPSPGTNNQGAAAMKPPQALQDLITFLQSLPNGFLKIPPQKIPVVAGYLWSAGLPQEEVEQLLLSPGFGAKGLSAADLQAAWQRVQSQAVSPETSAEPGARPSAEPEAKARQSPPGLTLPAEVQEILESPDYRVRWERLTVSEDMLPLLRLALARLGCSPQALARLDEEAQGEGGLSLARIWQVLQQSGDRVIQPEASKQKGVPPGENPLPSDVLEARPVNPEEVAEWRQLLLKAGVKPEVVEKMLGQGSPANQEDLKSTLLALAPPDEPPAALSEPKPLYLPENLRLRLFSPQGQNHWDQSQLNSQGSGEQPSGSAAPWSANPGETFVLPAFAAELQMFNPNVAGTGAPVSSTGLPWNPLAPEVRASLWNQLQAGIVSNLQPGESRVSFSLNPPEMGQIQLTLHLSGQEVAVTAVATRPEIAALATQGVQQLLQSLAQQGLVLTQFQVRLQDQPQVLTAAAQAGGREKSGESGERFTSSTRQRRGAVDRFV